ncbi:hypothetical protein DVH24_019253 [Malus domestica]|uniref:Bulb-type lectin domain-containing protein n=1 Tax=Malus domestica TaxID=3750 RepID=A0A498I2V9_MALDO|nr:hypothetical protein DVH24_019253 [Malus domestica]
MDTKILLCYALRFLLCCTFIAWGQTITSQSGTFELGFYKPGIPQNYYIGIWYKNLTIKTVVWVANKKPPVS